MKKSQIPVIGSGGCAASAHIPPSPSSRLHLLWTLVAAVRSCAGGSMVGYEGRVRASGGAAKH